MLPLTFPHAERPPSHSSSPRSRFCFLKRSSRLNFADVCVLSLTPRPQRSSKLHIHRKWSHRQPVDKPSSICLSEHPHSDHGVAHQRSDPLPSIPRFEPGFALTSQAPLTHLRTLQFSPSRPSLRHYLISTCTIQHTAHSASNPDRKFCARPQHQSASALRTSFNPPKQRSLTTSVPPYILNGPISSSRCL
jgi:hypothetical protein